MNANQPDVPAGGVKIVFDPAFEGLLQRRYRGRDIVLRTPETASVKNIVEALGVPHTEIGEILAGGRPVGFDHRPVCGSVVRLLPVPPPLDVTRPTRLRPEPFGQLRFIVDVNVGKLALLLRMLGFDTAYSPHWNDRWIAGCAEREQRSVLSRDVELLKHRQIRYGRLVRAAMPDDQLAEVVAFFGLQERCRPFSRCLRCNTALVTVEKEFILDRLEPKTRKYYHRFKRCPDCRRIYWRGSHHAHMIDRLQHAGLAVADGGAGVH